jgi:LacI family transcriptional regulator
MSPMKPRVTTRIPKLAEVARAAGVSRMTASRALNNRPGVSRPVREEILRLAGEMGYSVNLTAQKLASRRNRILALVAVQMHSPYVSEVVVGAVRAARMAGYEMLLYSLLDPDEQLPATVTQVIGQIAQGVIALLPYTHDYFGALRAAGVPLITVESSVELTEFPTIATDGYNGARDAMRHLMALGHRRIGYITGNERMASAVQRRRGYENGLTERGIRLDRTLIARGDYTQPSGIEAARRLLTLRHPPTAIFSGNDVQALATMAVASEIGLRIPEDLSVVGFDDIPQASQVHPPLTTVRQPMQQMGRSAVNTLLAMLAGIEVASPVLTLPTELVVRKSTAPPRKEGKRRRRDQRRPA